MASAGSPTCGVEPVVTLQAGAAQVTRTDRSGVVVGRFEASRAQACLSLLADLGQEDVAHVEPFLLGAEHRAQPPAIAADDADAVAGLQLGLEPFEHADVVLVDEEVHEAQDGALVVADARLQAGVSALSGVDHRADGGAFQVELFVAAGQAAKGRGDAKLHGHGFSSGGAVRHVAFGS